MPVPDIITQLMWDIETDDENKSERILEKYAGLVPEHRLLVDDLLIDICGYSLPTLELRAHDNGYFLTNENGEYR